MSDVGPDETDEIVDEIKLEYLGAYEAGRAPSLEDFAARYPQYRDELVDFVLTLLPLDACFEREQRARIRLRGW